MRMPNTHIGVTKVFWWLMARLSIAVIEQQLT